MPPQPQLELIVIQIEHLAAGVTPESAYFGTSARHHATGFKRGQENHVIVRHQLIGQAIMQVEREIVFFALKPVDFPVEVRQAITSPLGHVTERHIFLAVEYLLTLPNKLIHSQHQRKQLVSGKVLASYNDVLRTETRCEGSHARIYSHTPHRTLDLSLDWYVLLNLDVPASFVKRDGTTFPHGLEGYGFGQVNLSKCPRARAFPFRESVKTNCVNGTFPALESKLAEPGCLTF